MSEMQGTCTVVVIAHRLSTIKDADRIVVMDEGVVAEEGSHAELLQRDGLYATMVARQLENKDDGKSAQADVGPEIQRLFAQVPQEKQGELLKSLFMATKGKGKGKG